MTSSGGGLTGQWLGDYQLQGLLAVGGMAEVYRARDAVINREVAVKVLPLALAADPNYVERFRNEAQAVGALNHPNIVPILVFGEQGPLSLPGHAADERVAARPAAAWRPAACLTKRSRSPCRSSPGWAPRIRRAWCIGM